MSVASFQADGGAFARTFHSDSPELDQNDCSSAYDDSGGEIGISPAGRVVDLSRITYTYESEALPVLHDVSLTVERGEFVLILGPSGCGKSTLLHLMNGSVPHLMGGTLKGSATICGKVVADTKVPDFATDVGMVFQDPDAQIINTRVRDEVCFGLENLCKPVDEIMKRQAEALEFVGLSDLGDRSIFELSGGQKQRVSIAAVLAARPSLLVLDEPTANLDPAGMAEVFAVLARLNREHGTTIIMVEHRVDELADKVSRVVMMDRGTIVFDGSPRAAFSSRKVVHSEEANVVPTASWFPQVSEFGMDLAQAANTQLRTAQVPLSVEEAVALCSTLSAAPMQREIPPETQARRATEPLLSIRSLSFGYDRRAPILKDVNFELESNRIVALLGRNGSGKTTLARMLVGINETPAGVIHLGGKDISKLGAREIAAEVGYVFQNPDHQFVTDQVDEEVAYGLRVRGFADSEVARRVEDVLSVVDLARYRHRSPFSLSLGERRRLSVATMMVLEPRLLVLDEPTIGQDHERAQQLMGLMARLRERYSTTILMITHDVRLVAEWADRALVLRSGEIAFDGAPIELFAQSALLQSTGLLPPPIYEVSRRLSELGSNGGLKPVLSSQALVAALAAASQGRV
ncbi:energy-coupling factor transport system ATP-binding protein [Phyllobacterium trifolii]|uniref:Energy-coupling factor transport system ATP-binding protein n=1 Tax=Phyllobacterium trifolii TaxID=300193 RepID=A0A839UHQ8_9HYPH|nr:ABC transporter ATP-binding protein [Phyllobacterium trifolii]MBB3149465.1 energy-coupling factor transport system ATP-binding protein [Phyllobacterium trifolii]